MQNWGIHRPWGISMKVFRLFAVWFALLLPLAASAQAYDPNAPCGRDAYGNVLACQSVQPNMLEATCLTSADPRYCLPYHQRACQVSGFALACRLAAMGQNCQGGDPQQCQYYLSILRANTDCTVNGNQQACAWISQQQL